MVHEQSLVKTLDFQLDIRSDNESLLYDATLEARRVYNETVRLAKRGVDWDTISVRLADEADLVQNTTQRIVAKSLEAMRNSRTRDEANPPGHTKEGPYPLRANYEEGYDLTLSDGGEVRFRVSAKPYKHVKGVLKGSDAHLDILRAALNGEDWKIGTAETLFNNGTPELHVSVRNTERVVRNKRNSSTVVGVDVNEDNVALTALSKDGVEDTLVIEFPEIKFKRHQ